MVEEKVPQRYFSTKSPIPSANLAEVSALDARLVLSNGKNRLYIHLKARATHSCANMPIDIGQRSKFCSKIQRR